MDFEGLGLCFVLTGVAAYMMGSKARMVLPSRCQLVPKVWVPTKVGGSATSIAPSFSLGPVAVTSFRGE